MRVRVTRYGKSPTVGGWDRPGDSLTDKGFGAFDSEYNPTLNVGDCALAISVVKGIRANPHDEVLVTFPEYPEYKKTFQLKFNDKAPENSYTNSKFYVTDPDRLDIYLPYCDDPTIPEWGFAEIIKKAEKA